MVSAVPRLFVGGAGRRRAGEEILRRLHALPAEYSFDPADRSAVPAEVPPRLASTGEVR